jgi:hypothetical protein
MANMIIVFNRLKFLKTNVSPFMIGLRQKKIVFCCSYQPLRATHRLCDSSSITYSDFKSGWSRFRVMNRTLNLYVSRNIASLCAGGLRADSNPWKAKLILTSKAHVG